MKRVICFLLVLMLIMPVIASASEAPVTSVSTGYENILFSNGYRGYCIDRSMAGAYNGDAFTATGTSSATSNTTGQNISQQLKILFTQCFTEIFESDGNGEYQIKADISNPLLGVVYHFSEDQYVWGVQANLANTVKSYTGPEIPDSGYQLTLDNGDTVTFYFAVMQPENPAQQCFFAYKLAVSQESAHEHNFSEDWKSDEDKHWHECNCGEKKDVDEHQKTVINQKDATEFEEGYTGDTVCEDCGKVLEEGEPIPPTHEHDFSEDWKSDEDKHWHECDCGEKKDNADHTFNNGKCTICQKEDPNYESISPSTGDHSALALCLILSLLSICGFAWTTQYARKNGLI